METKPPDELQRRRHHARCGSPRARDLPRTQRLTTSSCGLCGKASLDAVRASSVWSVAHDDTRVGRDVLATLPDRLREAQRVFARTGGLHSAALFSTTGALRMANEDVGQPLARSCPRPSGPPGSEARRRRSPRSGPVLGSPARCGGGVRHRPPLPAGAAGRRRRRPRSRGRAIAHRRRRSSACARWPVGGPASTPVSDGAVRRIADDRAANCGSGSW